MKYEHGSRAGALFADADLREPTIAHESLDGLLACGLAFSGIRVRNAGCGPSP